MCSGRAHAHPTADPSQQSLAPPLTKTWLSWHLVHTCTAQQHQTARQAEDQHSLGQRVRQAH
jgi:hypothetical protein